MQEIKIAKLDKDDLKMFKEVEVLEANLKISSAQYHSKQVAMWELWRGKYKLGYGGHYIKDKSICRQV